MEGMRRMNFDGMSFEYEYPFEGLKPGDKIHDKLVDAIRARASFGRHLVDRAKDKWKEIDHTLTAFVPESEKDSFFSLAGNNKQNKPVHIVVPISRAARDIWITYMAGAYLNNVNGMYMLQGRGGAQGIVRAALTERFLNTQAVWFDHGLKHLMCWRDMYAYGIGCLAPVWAKHRRRQSIVEDVSDVLAEMVKGTGVKAGDIVRYMEDRVVHEGSELQNIDPYTLLIDPYCTVNEYQKAEYIGWMRRTNIMELLTRERDPEERMFNCKYVREMCRNNDALSEHWPVENPRSEAMGGDVVVNGKNWPGNFEVDTNPCDEIHLMWKLIPEEWGLGDSDVPEIYEFTLVGDQVITQANRLDYDHGMFPCLFGAPCTSGYDFIPVSGLAATYGMQRYIDFQFRSQIQNQAAALNNMFLYDPTAIEEEDILNPGPGKMIRTKRAIYGMGGVENFVKQFQVHDVTGGNIPNAQAMMNIMDIVLGTPDIMKGDLSGMPERPGAEGLAMARNTALSRFQTDAQIITEQMWYKLTHLLASNTIQFMSQDAQLSIVGSRFEQDIRAELGLPPGTSEVTLNPWNLDFSYDVMPVNRMQSEAELSALDTFLERALSVPDIAMAVFREYNPASLFRERMRRAGFANIGEYKTAGGQVPPFTTQVVSDAEAAAQAQAGNIVPVGGG